METWIPGLLALVGALSGVVLTNYLTTRSSRSDARRRRIEEALRAVVLAISARNFATRAGFAGKPEEVTDDQVSELQVRVYLDNVQQLFVTLREARHKVAILVADGIDVGESWRGDEEMQADLERVYQLLRSRLD